MGVKARDDPRLVTDMRVADVEVGAGHAHTSSVRWGSNGVLIACEQQVVYASRQRIDHPLRGQPGPAAPLPRC